MSPSPADDVRDDAKPRWWITWSVITLAVAAGAVLVIRLAPSLTPVLDSLR
ncbi:MAG: hypothetical protein H7066_14595 [Cytophagaceae bacterium]|nr:hypothetical protein [Gemmatimonadaceae bacterium]